MNQLLQVIVHVARSRYPPCAQIVEHIQTTISAGSGNKFSLVNSDVSLEKIIHEGIANGVIALQIQHIVPVNQSQAVKRRKSMVASFKREMLDFKKMKSPGKYYFEYPAESFGMEGIVDEEDTSAEFPQILTFVDGGNMDVDGVFFF